MVWLLLLALAAAVYGSWAAWRNYRQNTRHEAVSAASASGASATGRVLSKGTLPHFTLTDQRSQPFESSRLKGQVWVANFFFTSCPARCRRTCELLAELHRKPGCEELRLVSITCDPDNDRPSILAQYAQSLAADESRWALLTGEMKSIKALGEKYFRVGVGAQEHSDRCFVIDRAGKVQGSFYVTEPGQLARMQKLVIELIGQGRDGVAAAGGR
jgi:protein SCO1/2